LENLLRFHSGLAGDRLKLEKRGSISESEALELLAQATEYSKERAFDYVPINRAKIEELAREYSKGSLEETAQALEKSKGLEEKLASLVTGKQEEKLLQESPQKAADRQKGLVNFAKSCFWNSLLAQMLKRTRACKPTPGAKPAEVRLAASWEGWTVVKKAGSQSTNEEVLACLAGVYSTCSKKVALLAAGKNETELQQAVQATGKIMAGRRSIGRVAEVLPELARASQEAAQKLAQEPAKVKLLQNYLFDAALAGAGHAPYPSTDDLGRAYPSLKVPKPRGRMPGQKTKK
jgi:hypothetical protein